ncbi:hypothetical protein [Aliarcobacter butzleri]|uniref:hypothetical protein n=1 Tax=Aliarcobacter butzleri TaxID=28197 RepID=UPI002B24322B|nr:hypothetical protein [Aliarcobacter butzleri]
MAIKKSEYINKVDTGLKADKTHTYFYFRIKSNDKEYVKLFDFADKNWDVKTKKEKAKTFALSYKDSILNPKTELDTNIKLDTFAEMHFDKLENTTWTTTKKKHYYNYISKALGNKKVVDIKQMHIKEVIKCIRRNHSDSQPIYIRTLCRS